MRVWLSDGFLNLSLMTCFAGHQREIGADGEVQAPASAHREITERVRPSRLHVLQNFSPAPELSLDIATLLLVQPARACEARAKALDRFLVVKQRPGRASGAGDHARERTMPIEGFTSRSGHSWVFFRRTLRVQVAMAPLRCPDRLMPSGLGSDEGDYRAGWVPCSRLPIANDGDQLPIWYVSNGQPSALRSRSHSVLNLALPWTENISVRLEGCSAVLQYWKNVREISTLY